jgi:hypothetical protein
MKKRYAQGFSAFDTAETAADSKRGVWQSVETVPSVAEMCEGIHFAECASLS